MKNQSESSKYIAGYQKRDGIETKESVAKALATVNAPEAPRYIDGEREPGLQTYIRNTKQSPQHSPQCSSLPDSKASKYLGACYCDCGADSTRSTKMWKIVEEVHAITIVEAGLNPDDYDFGRVKPLCEIAYADPDCVAKSKLIVASVNHAQALADALRGLYEAFAWDAERTVEKNNGDDTVLQSDVRRARNALAAWERSAQ